MKPLVLLIAVLAMIPSTAMAAPVYGILDITGSVAVGEATIDWWPTQGGIGTFTIQPTSTGTFAALAGTTGAAKDLDVTREPVDAPFLLPDFLLFAAAPDIHFDLTFIEPGVFGPAQCFAAPAAGQTCTPPFPPPVSPFNLANSAGRNSTASFVVRGVAWNDEGFISPFVGSYSTQFTSLWYQDLLTAVANGGTMERSYSATFVLTVVPEPATWATMLVAGALAVPLLNVRKKKKPKEWRGRRGSNPRPPT